MNEFACILGARLGCSLVRWYRVGTGSYPGLGFKRQGRHSPRSKAPYLLMAERMRTFVVPPLDAKSDVGCSELIPEVVFFSTHTVLSSSPTSIKTRQASTAGLQAGPSQTPSLSKTDTVGEAEDTLQAAMMAPTTFSLPL